MKKFFVSILIVGLFFPARVFAHGGVQRTAGSVLVTLFQTPISPFVGETVNFTFVLTNSRTNQTIPRKTVRLEVIQTTVGDESKDKVVYKKEVTSDINGDISFNYTFPRTNYYDVELQFGKEGDELTSVGFLVQPRDSLTLTAKIIEYVGGVSILLNIVLAYFLLRRSRLHA